MTAMAARPSLPFRPKFRAAAGHCIELVEVLAPVGEQTEALHSLFAKRGRDRVDQQIENRRLFLAFSTANPIPRARLARGAHDYRFLADEEFDPFYMAAVEATEEAVLNAMAAAEDMTTLRPPGKVCRALDMPLLVAAVSGRA